MLNSGEGVCREAEKFDGATTTEEGVAGTQMKEAEAKYEEKALLALDLFA